MSLQSKPPKIKVCLVTISLAKGGAERSCALLTEILFSLGYEVHTAVLNDRIDFPYKGSLLNLGLGKKTGDSFFKRVGRLKKLRAYLIEKNIDFIIDHRPKNSYYRELIYHRWVYRGFRTIYVTHSSNKTEYLTQRPEKFASICNKNVKNVAVSNYIEDYVLKEDGVRNTITIHNAFDPSWEKEDEPTHENLEDKQYILSYGRIVDNIKDFKFLISSFEESGLWEDEVYLVIMGDGPDKEEIIHFAGQTASSKFILFLPFQNNPFGIIKKAHFVTLTSKYEGFPMVIVESLSQGVPVVSLDIVSGPNEIIVNEMNGLLIEKRSIPLFARAINRMMTEEQLYQRCKDNSRSSVQKFSMQEIGKKWNNVLSHEA